MRNLWKFVLGAVFPVRNGYGLVGKRFAPRLAGSLSQSTSVTLTVQ